MTPTAPEPVIRQLEPRDEEQVMAAHAELLADGFDFALRHDGEPWQHHLDRIARERDGVDLAPGRVPATFLVLVVDGVVAGRVSVRHRLNDHLLQVGGHIGYAVRPAYRRRGYATLMLHHGLGLLASRGVERALVTCDDDNVASAAVIERAGGVLEDVRALASGPAKRRYWIPTAVDPGPPTKPSGYAPLALHLETERLVLTPQTDDDAAWMAELLTARDDGRTWTTGDALEKIATMRETIASLGIGVLAVRRRTDAEPLGYCGLVVGRSTVAEPEVAYELLPWAHGRGYATEAARAVVDAAFATGRARLWATIRSWNAPSLRVAEKLGFRPHRVETDADGDVIWHVLDAPAPAPSGLPSDPPLPV
ncbi:GNAT family N-acetyltransferase [Actinotalea sp. Marseille-Q4924]|uniref:GNAT family N-acetyltransferase n=1 Tax=Actinotalea sp. Marseille-Q4924 TaxID=2866571 RepID=UPI001CE3EC2C|nr:GNAT family N-acetyltransferase [Actinotalea sp. Marseille-Q4924]